MAGTADLSIMDHRTFVVGTPVPQGSKRGFLVNGRIVLVEASKNLPQWRKTVTASLVGMPPVEGAAEVVLGFYMPKPKSNKDDHPIRRPDVDKLIRAVLDGMTDAGIFKDDSQVVSISARKLWAKADPGVSILYRPFGVLPGDTRE